MIALPSGFLKLTIGISTTLRARTLHCTSSVLDPPSSALLALPSLINESHHSLARKWLDSFTVSDIPKDSYIVTRSRSSGPGGQHVNKTESKVTIRCKVDWLPPFVIPPMSKSPYYISSPPSILISSQTSRTATQNQTSALGILYQTIASSAKSQIQGETSEKQKERVRGLEKRENAKRLELKKRHSAKKASRRDI